MIFRSEPRPELMMSKEVVHTLNPDELYLILNMAIWMMNKEENSDFASLIGWDREKLDCVVQRCVEKGFLEVYSEGGEKKYIFISDGICIESWRGDGSYQVKPDEDKNRVDSMSGKEKPGYCYLMIDHNTGYHKIGFSKRPKYRERTLQSEKPTIELLKKWKGSFEDEAQLHEMFSEKRIRGEWFDLTPEDVEFIQTL